MVARGSTPLKGHGGHISLAGLLLAAPPAMKKDTKNPLLSGTGPPLRYEGVLSTFEKEVCSCGTGGVKEGDLNNLTPFLTFEYFPVPQKR